MSANSIGASTSFGDGDLATQLSPSNLNQTVQNMNENKKKLVAMSTNTIQTLQIETKKRYYQETFNGDPTANPPQTRMTIFGVFKSYVSYKTPDDQRQTPKGTVMDISRVVQGLRPTFESLPDAKFSPDQMSKSTLFVNKILKTPTLASIQDFIQKVNESVDAIANSGNSSLLQEFETIKQSLEVYRQPMIDAMFAFDDPDLAASQQTSSPSPAPRQSPSPAPGQSPSPAPGQSPSPAPGQSPSPAPGQSPSPAPGQSPSPAPQQSLAPTEEGFSLMVSPLTTWISSDVGWILLSILGVLVASLVVWTWTTGKSMLSMCRRCSTRRVKSRIPSRRSRR
jgi:hypothetical protein